ncbi:MAG: hypothetical protein AMJ93_15605 [Anaerolineae bacterium SM23_84]|nr:MAG: hypothetical protein AMJ93_15605 [Anaerolineae bacterium SM23_84]
MPNAPIRNGQESALQDDHHNGQADGQSGDQHSLHQCGKVHVSYGEAWQVPGEEWPIPPGTGGYQQANQVQLLSSVAVGSHHNCKGGALPLAPCQPDDDQSPYR